MRITKPPTSRDIQRQDTFVRVYEAALSEFRRVGVDQARIDGRQSGSYVLTVLETIGGGTSEVQRNIIATRKLGLPRNF